ncbi:MAG: hypothetical protein ABH840_03930 [Nanoarchaeota archaeon]
MRITDGFTVKNWKSFKPVEDAYSVSNDGKAIAVADKITRDPRRTPMLQFPKHKLDLLGYLGAVRFFANHPESGNDVSGLLCSLFRSRNWKEANCEEVRKEVGGINSAIGRLNEYTKLVNHWKEFDYLEHDIPGTVAAGAVEDNGKVNYFYIADCGIAVFDKYGNIKFKTKNEGPNSRGSIDYDVKKKFKTSFDVPEGRKIIRENYRNKPENPLSYGALTGEEEAMSYVRIGETVIQEGELLKGYSDGLEDVIGSKKFGKLLFKGIWRKDFRVMKDNLRRFCKSKVRSEGTLVYMLR